MRVGILTGGGDCPGLNAVVRAFVMHGVARHGLDVVGFLDGWRGLIDGRRRSLAPADVDGLVHVGGTMLGTSRTNPYRCPEQLAAAQRTWDEAGLDGLVAIGGEDTLGVANRLHEDGRRVVGVPKTIDNDLLATDSTIGFDSAVNVAMECVDRLRTTAASHHRTMVVEVMGRDAGWIAAHVGIAAGADVTLLPEFEVDLERTCDLVRRRCASPVGFSLVVIAEGVRLPGEDGQGGPTDAFGHPHLGGVGERLAARLEERTGIQARPVVLGYLQRGGPPSAADRVLGARLGCAAADLAGRGEFGRMLAIHGTEVVAVPLAAGVSAIKRVDRGLYEVMRALEA